MTMIVVMTYRKCSWMMIFIWWIWMETKFIWLYIYIIWYQLNFIWLWLHYTVDMYYFKIIMVYLRCDRWQYIPTKATDTILYPQVTQEVWLYHFTFRIWSNENELYFIIYIYIFIYRFSVIMYKNTIQMELHMWKLYYGGLLFAIVWVLIEEKPQ